MLLLLVLGMLEVLAVLVVLKELVVFVRGEFETVKSPNFFWGENYRIQKEKNYSKNSLRQSQKSTFRVLHSIIPLLKDFRLCPTSGPTNPPPPKKKKKKNTTTTPHSQQVGVDQ